MTETLRSAMAALAHSAQADGLIERSTAIWAAEEGRKAADRIDALTAQVAAMAEGLKPFANSASRFEDKYDFVSPRPADEQGLIFRICDYRNDADVTCGDLRRAARALAALKGEE